MQKKLSSFIAYELFYTVILLATH